MSFYSRDETIGHAVTEGNECQSYEGRDGIANILPVDARDLAYHQTTNLVHYVSVGITQKIDRVEPTLTRTKVPPVAQGGTEARIGAKNKDSKKQKPVEMAVRPVRPPSAIPAPLSINAVTGEQPKRDPMEMQAASVQ